MIEDDNLNGIAGEPAGDTVNPSEANEATKVATEAKKDSQPDTKAGDDAANPEGDGAGEPAGDKKPSGAQRNKEKLARAEDRARAAEERAAALQAKLAEVEKRAIPKLEDFPDWDAHQAATQSEVIDRTLTKREAEFAAQEAKEARQALIAEAVAAHRAREAEARQRIPDYDAKLAEYRGPMPSDFVQELMFQSDKSELFLLHIAKDADLVRDLNRMPPVEAARRIGQIEARLSYPTPKTATNAPPPMGTLKGAASATPDPSKMNFLEFKAYRESGGTITR
jgi:hypothetical protein